MNTFLFLSLLTLWLSSRTKSWKGKVASAVEVVVFMLLVSSHCDDDSGRNNENFAALGLLGSSTANGSRKNPGFDGLQAKAYPSIVFNPKGLPNYFMISACVSNTLCIFVITF